MAEAVVPTKIAPPESGVRLTDGVLAQAHINNIAYLKSLSMDSILYWFRVKGGLPAPGDPFRGHFEDNIKGQTAGLFLMGAANSLRWSEDGELRDKLNDIVECIETTREPDGFFEPIPKSEFGTKEYPNYVRVWLNYGLAAAHMVGHTRALALMRDMQSWFNVCDERVIAKDLALGFQGVIANTTVYLSEIGIPDDLDVTVDYYQENWWLAQFISGDDSAVHGRPRPHGTELEAITAYMDLYLATGKPLYLNAVNGAYRMFRDKWQHVGGGIVAIEHTDMFPGCAWLDPIHKYNELCCTAHWVYLNQRYHRLYPEEEGYVAEIEKSLYNVAVANQIGIEHIRYHAFLDIQKDGDRKTPVSCCAGLGTRLFGSLPEFLYSVAPDGIYIDIYAGSEFAWQQDGVSVEMAVGTDQPQGGNVSITVSPERPVAFKLRLRVPSWAASDVSIELGGKKAAGGKPGTYVTIDRTWEAGDKLAFDLPFAVTSTRYTGRDTVPGCDRYAFEYGPLLLGLVGALDFKGRYIKVNQDPLSPDSWLAPVAGKPGHFTVAGKTGYELMPYFEIQDQVFSCYPVFG